MFVRIILGHPVYFLNNHGQLWFKKYITLIRNYETVRVKKVCTPLLKKSVEYLYLNKENIKICPANFSKEKKSSQRSRCMTSKMGHIVRVYALFIQKWICPYPESFRCQAIHQRTPPSTRQVNSTLVHINYVHLKLKSSIPTASLSVRGTSAAEGKWKQISTGWARSEIYLEMTGH